MKKYIIVLDVDGHKDTEMYWNYTKFEYEFARIFTDEFTALICLDLANEYLVKNNAEDMKSKLVEITI